ncbi:MAG: hypothetical protein H6739_03255 [Alphaproteobacteria bacterium]|nr:hypothetical protein [Alphaproteobacteria bacterium]
MEIFIVDVPSGLVDASSDPPRSTLPLAALDRLPPRVVPAALVAGDRAALDRAEAALGYRFSARAFFREGDPIGIFDALFSLVPPGVDAALYVSDRPDAPALIRELDATTHVPVRHLRGPAAPLIARLGAGGIGLLGLWEEARW